MATNHSRSLSRISRPPTVRPAVDEWGIYDPSQAGLAALFERVEEKRRAVPGSEAENVAASMRDVKTLPRTEPEKT